MVKTKKTTSTAKAISLHIGLNAVSGSHYGGWTGDLMACEFDAKDMTTLAKSRGIKPNTLLTKNATRAKVLSGIRNAAKSLKTGDLFFLSYSGHGGQIPDTSGDEADKFDETWCLFDGELIDDELYLELSRFAPGVRILVLSDSCHSGSVTRAPMIGSGPLMAGIGRSKMMPPAVAMRTYREHQKFYDTIQKQLIAQVGKSAAGMDLDLAPGRVAQSPRLKKIAKAFNPAVILISGCQDNQTSMDGDHNGAFTEQLLLVWNDGAFKGTYAKFHAAIKARMPSTQSPNFFTLGKAGPFAAESPFTV